MRYFISLFLYTTICYGALDRQFNTKDYSLEQLQFDLIFLVIFALAVIAAAIYRGKKYKREALPPEQHHPASLTPQNSLEEKLIAIEKGEYDHSLFITNDFPSEIFYLRAQKSLSHVTTSFTINMGAEEALVICSSPDRFSRVITTSSDYTEEYALSGKEILEIFAGSYGLILNPEWETELLIEAPQVIQFSEMLKKKV